jgi:UrcA family protein
MNIETHTSRRLAVLVLALHLAIPALAVELGRGLDGPSTTVATAGLDTSQISDAEVLYARIRTAALSVCRAAKARWDVKRVRHQQLCVAEAVENAVARADQPLLTALHRASRERFAER